MAYPVFPHFTSKQVNNRIFFYDHEYWRFIIYDLNEKRWLNPIRNYNSDFGLFCSTCPNYWRDMACMAPNLIDRITILGYTYMGENVGGRDGFVGVAERIYKVAEQFLDDIPYTQAELLYECVDCAIDLQSIDSVSEKEVIEYINAKKQKAKMSSLIRYTQDFKTEKLLNQYLPPLEFDEDEMEIAIFLAKQYPLHVKQIAKILSTHFLTNLFAMVGHNKTEEIVTDYLKWCDVLEKEPSFSGNFIKKYAEVERLYKDKKEKITAKAMRKNQQKRELVFSAHGLTVVVPLTLEELIEEGHAQHNCVGEYGYNERIAEGKRYIVFIRDENDIEQSLVTCEIDACDGEIIQFLLAYNNELYECKDSKLRERLEAYQDDYQEYLFNMWRKHEEDA